MVSGTINEQIIIFVRKRNMTSCCPVWSGMIEKNNRGILICIMR